MAVTSLRRTTAPRACPPQGRARLASPLTQLKPASAQRQSQYPIARTTARRQLRSPVQERFFRWQLQRSLYDGDCHRGPDCYFQPAAKLNSWNDRCGHAVLQRSSSTRDVYRYARYINHKRDVPCLISSERDYDGTIVCTSSYASRPVVAPATRATFLRDVLGTSDGSRLDRRGPTINTRSSLASNRDSSSLCRDPINCVRWRRRSYGSEQNRRQYGDSGGHIQPDHYWH